MTAYPKPTRAQVIAALQAKGVNLVIEPIRANSEGRPWRDGLRAIVDHHTAGTNSLGYLLNRGGTYPFVNTLIDRGGTVHLLSTQSVWGSGAGGPWPGVAGKNSLHLVGWQNEVEDLGTGRTFTQAQKDSLGRVNAALVGLGVPRGNEVNHHDWTDGNAPVGGYPLPTKGRKNDTRYTGDELRANTARFISSPPAYPGKPLGWNNPYRKANAACQRALTNAGYPTPVTGTYVKPTDDVYRANIEAYANRHTHARDLDDLAAGAIGPNLYASLMTYYYA